MNETVTSALSGRFQDALFFTALLIGVLFVGAVAFSVRLASNSKSITKWVVWAITGLIVLVVGLYCAGQNTLVAPLSLSEVSTLQNAAMIGNVDAQMRLGMIYESGMGLPQNYAEAAKWFRKAAEKGNRTAFASLGDIYANGNGVKKDYAEAYFWYSLAGNFTSGTGNLRRDAIANQLTANQKSETDRRVDEWQKAHSVTSQNPPASEKLPK